MPAVNYRGDSWAQKISRARLVQFNKNLLAQHAQASGQKSYVPSKYTVTQAPTGTQKDAKSSLMSRVTLGKASTISKRAKAVPNDALFKADIESVKSKNEKKLASNDETESQKFGRWMMRTEQDKAEAI